MPRSHEALGQSTVMAKHVPVGNHTASIASTSPHDVSKNFELCGRRTTRGWRFSMFNFQTWATKDFVPIEGQLVVLLTLTGQMSHNRIWLGKYDPSVHSRASPDPERRCTTDRMGIPKPARHPHGTVRFPQNCTYGCSHARMKSTGAPRVPAREPYGTCKVHVWYLATLWPKNMQITHRTPVCIWPQHRIIPTSGPGP